MNDEQAMNQRIEKKKVKPAGTGIPPHVLRFLNSLPVDPDPMEWIIKFRDALRLLLGDVDRIALFINMNCSLLYETDNTKSLITSQIGDARASMNGTILASRITERDSLIEIYHDHLRRAGFPFQDYQAPASFLYSVFTEQSSLGALWLFRRRGSSPISAATLDTMERLRPFMIFALSHRVAQNIMVQPQSSTYFQIVNELLHTLGLTPREKEVLPLRLLGFQNKAIADKLFISEGTVIKHVRKILRKGKSQSFIELFMRYYVPELDAPDFLPSLPPVAPRRDAKKRKNEDRPLPSPNTVLLW